MDDGKPTRVRVLIGWRGLWQAPLFARSPQYSYIHFVMQAITS